jgi:hypothetical protein
MKKLRDRLVRYSKGKTNAGQYVWGWNSKLITRDPADEIDES